MTTSENVRKVTFERAMRGYRCEDVDAYLKDVADSMDALTAQIMKQQNNVQVLAQQIIQYRQQIEQYRQDEGMIQSIMVEAQRTANKVLEEAKQTAVEIIRAARIKAEEQERISQAEVEQARQEAASVRKETEVFIKSIMEMYKEHINLLRQVPTSGATERAESDMDVPRQEMPVQPKQPVKIERPIGASAQTAAPQQIQPQQNEYQPLAEEKQWEEKKVDTVEFTAEPIPEDSEAERVYPVEEEPRFEPGAGLYDMQEVSPPEKKPAKGRGHRSSKKKEEAAESKAFSDVGFED